MPERLESPDEDGEAEADDLGGRAQADRGGAARTVGEGQEGRVKEQTERVRCRAPRTSSGSITLDQL